MQNLYALTRRELGSLFLRPSLHVVTAFFVLLYGLYFSFGREQVALFEPLALIICFLSIFLTPLITMRSFAEEADSGTLELLMTAPVGAGEVVLSKFLACFAFYLTTLLPCFVYIALLAACGKVDRPLGNLDSGEVTGGLVALVLVGAMFMAIGIFLSSLTTSQVIAAASTCVTILILLMFAIFEEHGQGLSAFVGYLSFVPHFKRFLPGIIDTRDVVYFLSLPVCLLVITTMIVGSRATLARERGLVHRRWELAAGVSLAFTVISALFGIARIHVNGIAAGQLAEFLKKSAATTALGYVTPFIAACVCLAVFFICLNIARGTSTRGAFAGLRQKQSTMTLLGVLGVILITLNLNFLAFSSWSGLRETPVIRYLSVLRHRSWDISSSKSNTLALDTRMTLDAISGNMEIYVFYSADVDYQGIDLLDETRKLLTRYSDYSPNIHITYADPIREPEKSNRLCKELKLNPGTLTRVAMIAFQGRRAMVPASLCLKPPSWKEQLAGLKTPKYNGELVFTLGIKRMLDPRVTRVYFSTGHKELSINSEKNDPGFAGKFAGALKRDGFDVRKIILNGQPLPYDCNVLVIMGPHIPFSEQAAKSLAEYLGRGGRMMLTLPSVMSLISKNAIPDQDDRGLFEIMKTWGCFPRRDIIFDQQHNDAGMPTTIQALATENHPISRAGRGVVCLLPYARSMRIKPGKAQKNGWLVQRLLVSCESAMAKKPVRDRESGRYRLGSFAGPFDLAVAASSPGDQNRQEGRVVVVGNTEFISNLSLGKGHNQPFALSCVHWLSGRDYKIRIEPRKYVDRSLKLTGKEQRLLQWVSLAALPMAWLLLGALVWWARKQ